MIEGLVTVVVPVYNVEKYLDRCLESIVNQTYTNLEIILVDDGSPDNCPAMCDDWAKKDSRIKVIHKQNEGLGYARNTGLDHATGEFVCFVDSDDYVALDMIEKTYAAAMQYGAEIVTYGFSIINCEGELTRKVVPHTDKTYYENDEIVEYVLPNMISPDVQSGIETNMRMSMWSSLFSMELIKMANWRVTSERKIIAEDVYSLLILFGFVKKFVVIKRAFYYYCENGNSLTHTYRKDRYEKIKYFYDECLKICDEQGYDENIKQRLIYPYFSFTIAALKMIVKVDMTRKEKKRAVRTIIKDEHMKSILKKYYCPKEKYTRKLLLCMMKYKMSNVCYLMLQLKR